MSAKKITGSERKLQAWAEIRALDRAALAIAEREGIALMEAYPKAFAELQREAWAKEQR